MERTSPPSYEADAELSQRAELTVSFGPPPQWGTARGLVPADQVHHLVTTAGILGSLITGIAGATLTLHAVQGFDALALAELTLALVAAVLIALCSRTRIRRSRRPKAAQVPARKAGTAAAQPQGSTDPAGIEAGPNVGAGLPPE